MDGMHCSLYAVDARETHFFIGRARLTSRSCYRRWIHQIRNGYLLGYMIYSIGTSG